MTVTPTPNHNTAENQQVLKLVPPQTKAPDKPSQLQPQESQPPAISPQKPAASPWKKWAIIGTVALGLGGISLISLPNFVTGDSEITSRENARQLVKMPRAGRIQLRVKEKDPIRKNQLVAEVESDELNQQITQAEKDLEQAKVSLNSAQQELSLTRSRLQSAQVNESIMRDRLAIRQQELNNPGILPDTQRTDREKQAILAEVPRIQSEIAAIEADIIGLEGELKTTELQFSKYQNAYVEGAIPEKIMLELQDRKNTLAATIAQKQATIQAREAQITQQQSLASAKTAETSTVIKNTSDTVDRVGDDLAQVMSQTQTAQQEVNAAEEKVRSHQQLLVKLTNDLTQINQQRENLKLYAETEGIVTTKDLDLKNDGYFNSGEEILSIVDLTDLEAEVKIHPEDRYLVEVGATVHVYLKGNNTPYTATVESIDPMAQPSEQQQKPMLSVQILIENEEEAFLLGAKSYAHIQTENLRVYQKIGHELNKLLNIRKYLPWLTSNFDTNS
ncbi:MAG: HlyD family efflux transporter periplasmic adaptor subunit [Jaaginema sp. PMC 1079.18]|nr:HlyD family efflux transporter periplasmic adaptor subunit [Jaaginema sp. PMC 1080.18]MEC4849954.1 HlyD family efflux transporter periplasmic adaptor subunit [Jaaginema sp. PMC 1079.18]MEC4866144.1 HlyD family efflux transporter periplasmic adaptor subunit [Jaaginema sp. PMC 1078.18]